MPRTPKVTEDAPKRRRRRRRTKAHKITRIKKATTPMAQFLSGLKALPQDWTVRQAVVAVEAADGLYDLLQ